MRSIRSHGLADARIVTFSAAALILAACQVPQSGYRGALQARAAATAQNSQPSAQSQFQSIPKAAKPIVSSASGVSSMPGVSNMPGRIPVAAIPASIDAAIGPAFRLTGDPKQLVGLDHATVRRALGDPAWIRREDPAQVWQYSTGDCVVDLYLYNLGGALKVTFIEARSHKAEAEPTARCLKSLLERPTARADQAE